MGHRAKRRGVVVRYSTVPRLLVLTLILAAVCSAQRGRVDVRGDVGWTGFLDDSTDNHLLLGGSLATYLSKRVSFQPEFQFLRRSGGIVSHYDLALVANVAFDMRSPGARVVPYLIVGPGIIHTRQGRFSNTQMFATGGGGVKVFLNDRWYVAPDFRIGWEPHARFSVGVGYVWRR